MDIYDIIDYLILGIVVFLVLWLVYSLITRPKEILFSILRYMKGGTISATIIFSPIWIPAWLLDKRFKLGIYRVDSDISDDIIYESEKDLSIDFKVCQKFIFAKSVEFRNLVATITNCYETTPDIDFVKFKYLIKGETIIIKTSDSCTFYNYHYLVQWLDTYLTKSKHKEIYGLVVNNSNPDSTYYVVADKTGIHINSLTGKTLKGDKFSINLLDDFEINERLGINNAIKLDRKLDIDLLLAGIENIELKDMKMNTTGNSKIPESRVSEL